jgi:hypothetical protein
MRKEKLKEKERRGNLSRKEKKERHLAIHHSHAGSSWGAN